MSRVKLRNIVSVIDELDYPLTREAVQDERDDVTLVLADGEIALEEVLEASSETVFDSRDELLGEIMSNLPRIAVGEPGQSEGDA